jgi:hypothetical protein
VNQPLESLVRSDADRDTDAGGVTQPWPASFVVGAAVLSIAFTAFWLDELVAPLSALRVFF